MVIEHAWPTRMKNNARTAYTSEAFLPPLHLAWKYKKGEYIWTSPTTVDEKVYIPGDGIVALDVTTGEIIWLNEKVKSNIGFNSATFWEDKLVVCGLEQLYFVDASNGSIVMFIPHASVYSSPCLYLDTVYAGIVGRHLLAVDAITGETKWVYDVSIIIHFTPSASNGEVYCAGVGYAFALDASSGGERWKISLEGDPPNPIDTLAIYQDSLLIAVKGSGLHRVEKSTGKVLWRYETRYGPFYSPLYLRSGWDRICCR